MVNNVDNFDLIKEFVKNDYNGDTDIFDKDKDAYYVIELLRRGKDNPDLPAANVHFKNYYINKLDDFDKYKDEIIMLCNMFNMRAYFAVNVKSYKQVMMDTVAETARRVAAHDYKKPYSIYESCSGSFFKENHKIWIIDIDKEDADKYNMSIDMLVKFYKTTVEKMCKPNKEIIDIIPTRSGKHIICHPFDVAMFNSILVDNGMEPHSDNKHQIIKKNHLTLLYCKKKMDDDQINIKK